MTRYTLSEAADSDLRQILMNSMTHWGIARAERYIFELHKAFENLATFPNLGRNADHVRQGYFQLQHVSHNVFYKMTGSGVFIVRVLHHKQLPKNYL